MVILQPKRLPNFHNTFLILPTCSVTSCVTLPCYQLFFVWFFGFSTFVKSRSVRGFRQDGMVTKDEFKDAVQNLCVGKPYDEFPHAMKAFIGKLFNTIDLNGKRASCRPLWPQCPAQDWGSALALFAGLSPGIWQNSENTREKLWTRYC